MFSNFDKEQQPLRFNIVGRANKAFFNMYIAYIRKRAFLFFRFGGTFVSNNIALEVTNFCTLNFKSYYFCTETQNRRDVQIQHKMSRARSFTERTVNLLLHFFPKEGKQKLPVVIDGT